MNKFLPPKYSLEILSLLALCGMWEVAALYIDNPLLFPGIWELLQALVLLFTEKNFLASAGYTLLRGSLGMICAILLATLIARPMSRHPSFSRFAHFPLSALRSVPVISFILLFLIWLRPAQIPFVMALITMTPVLIENLSRGFSSVDRRLYEMGRVFRLNRRAVVTHITYPAIKPFFFSGLISATGLGWKAIIIGEALAQPEYGIGVSIKEAQGFIEIPRLIAWTLLAIVISFILESLLRKLGTYSFPVKYSAVNRFLSQEIAHGICCRNLRTDDRTGSISYPPVLDFPQGRITGLQGASGRGKTTLLFLIAGLKCPSAGEIRPRSLSGTAFSFQEPRLLPELTVLENITLPIGQFYTRAESVKRVAPIIKELGLENLSQRFPETLSGGERQRVSLARALVFPSPTLLLDEPFTGIDNALKQKIIYIIQQLQSIEPRTVILVTHHKDELIPADSIIQL